MRIAPVFSEDGGAAKLDLAFALLAVLVHFFPGCYDLVRFGVDEAGGDEGEGPADTAVDAVVVVEAAAEGHADFGHAVALEEDIAAAEGCPGGFGGGGEGGGAGDVEAEVGG